MKYNELTRRYFDAAPGAGTLDEPGRLRGAAGDRSHGAWVQFDVRASRNAEIIEAVRFLAFACPHVIAVSAWVAEHAPGLGIEPRLPQTLDELRERFAVPTEKMGRLLIVEDAWIAAMQAAR
jgi:NifU-like protein involved in Fe-S cluster formation